VTWEESVEFANELSALDGFASVYSTDESGDYVFNVGADGYRLPTEAEWEYAARCGEDTLYVGADVIDDVGWYSGNSAGTTIEVATKSPNTCGIYDMSGNVEEWTWDWYESGYYSEGDMTDPVGPSSSSVHDLVVRGGSFNYGVGNCRVSNRRRGTPGSRNGSQGFRLVRTVHTDADGDGYVAAEDCDDDDPSIYPYAGDIYDDGIDSDCDGLDCEATWHSDNTYFAVCVEIGEMNWDQGRLECNNAGYEYASILDASEYSTVASLEGVISAHSYWLGGTDALTEGTWAWTDGSSWAYENWNVGEPNDSLGNEDCLEFSIGTGWNDISCDHTQAGGYVCQFRTDL
jgi:hypothetical protein